MVNSKIYPIRSIISPKRIILGAFLIFFFTLILNSIIFAILIPVVVAYFTCPFNGGYKIGMLNGFLEGLLASVIMALFVKEPISFVIMIGIFVGCLCAIGGSLAVLYYNRFPNNFSQGIK